MARRAGDRGQPSGRTRGTAGTDHVGYDDAPAGILPPALCGFCRHSARFEVSTGLPRTCRVNRATLESLRMTTGLSVEEFSKACGVAPETYRKNWLNEKPVYRVRVEELARKYGLPLTRLVHTDPGPAPPLLAGDGLSVGKLDPPPDVLDGVVALNEMIRLAATIMKMPPNLNLRVVAEYEGCMQIEIAGSPEHLAWLREAHRRGAFASLNVLYLEQVFGDEVEHSASNEPAQPSAPERPQSQDSPPTLVFGNETYSISRDDPRVVRGARPERSRLRAVLLAAPGMMRRVIDWFLRRGPRR